MQERIAVIAAHPDDEALGCGGSLLKYKHFGY
ncbi:TPA: PIG-L family deacetylase, partial [Legionella pneumophila]|nr:PIG-L family deacetylase [Legionella pneumophila]